MPPVDNPATHASAGIVPGGSPSIRISLRERFAARLEGPALASAAPWPFAKQAGP